MSLYNFVRGRLYIWVTGFLAALYMLEQYTYVPIGSQLSMLAGWGALMVTFMTLVAFITYLRLQIRRVVRKSRRWPLAIWAIIVSIGMVILGNVTPQTTNYEPYTWIYFNVLLALFLAALSMTHFIRVPAMYRGFRVRNFESSILFVLCIFVLFSTIPIIGGAWPQIPDIGLWILNHPSAAANRAGVIITGIGAVGIALRIWLGKEKGLRAG